MEHLTGRVRLRADVAGQVIELRLVERTGDDVRAVVDESLPQGSSRRRDR